MLKSLNHLLGKVTNQPQWQGPLEFQRLLKSWPEIVGSSSAQQTRPYLISRDVLYVATSSSVWCQELKFKRHQILKKVNALLSAPLTDIHFSTARWKQDLDSGNVALPPQPSSHVVKVTSEAPQEQSSILLDPQAPQEQSSTLLDPQAPQEQSSILLDPQATFQQWAQKMQANSRCLPLCPQCQCPTPDQEIQRWNVCGLCAAKHFGKRS